MATHPEGDFDLIAVQQGFGEGTTYVTGVNDGYGDTITPLELDLIQREAAYAGVSLPVNETDIIRFIRRASSEPQD